MNAIDAARAIVEEVRARPWGLAVGVLCEGEVRFELDEGADPLTEQTLFQFGSVTKTITGLLLADCVVRGEITLDATVGSTAGADAGAAADVTLLSLATQSSGLPRLPPNLDPAAVDPDDPYATYGETELWEALRLIDPPRSGGFEYSNFGFMLLGALLTRITGEPYESLAKRRVFDPLGMSSALVGTAEGDRAVPGYRGSRQVPWWRDPVPGAGGVAGSIRDLGSYLQAHLAPPAALSKAIGVATAEQATGGRWPVGLGWVHKGGGLWHNGATGGFRSFVAFHPPTKTAVAILVNGHDAELIDGVGFEVLTRMVGSRT